MGDSTNPFEYLTPQVKSLLDRASFEVTNVFYHPDMGVGHVLLSFISRPDETATGKLLHRDFRMEYQNVQPVVRHMAMPHYNATTGRPSVVPYQPSLTRALKRALELARKEAGEMKAAGALIRTDHVLKAILELDDPQANRIFRAVGVDPAGVKAAIELMRERRSAQG